MPVKPRVCDGPGACRIYRGVTPELTADSRATPNLGVSATVSHLVTTDRAVGRGSFAVSVDEILLAGARAGEEAALEQLFRRFEVPVYSLARRLTRSTHDAEDVVQETFLEVVRSIRRFRGEGSLAGWIRKVAASKALMKLRAAGGRTFEEIAPDELGEDAGAGPSHRSAVSTAAERVDLESALGRLPDASRAVIWLHDVEGYSHDEIAAMAGKTPSFSKSQLARAHARLREMLAPARTSEGPCT
ncbi:MAG TPA: sigma-70 family RNA polymerase sigma factor [Thermoanaerobaculaceae bacterium]|nr:sigma-70 family RNA polymerase sigma factor [Thermoanaerobaculaceae bacterium]